MTNTLCKIIACALWLIVSASVATCKDWRGIMPLKSTRADVERLLGAPNYSDKVLSYYSLRTEIVVFQFGVQTCADDLCGFGWNVPIGTVVAIGVIPKGTHRKQEYQSSSDFKIADHGAAFTYYEDDSAGLAIETFKDRVTLVNYYQSAAQAHLRCPQKERCIVESGKFDEYGGISFADEKARLDNFLIQLKSSFSRGIIEVHGPSKKARQQRLKAARARTYLLNLGLAPERILVVDGGFSEEPLTRLFVYSIGGAGSVIYVHREPDPDRK